MSTVIDCAKCKQCGYEFGVFELNCHTNEWDFDCLRCGHCESRERVLAADGSGVGWKHESFEGHGAVWATGPGNGVSTFLGLRSAQDVEQAAQKMRDSIANGELDPNSSYVTRWDPESKRAEVLAGTWCQDGEVFGTELFDMTKLPVDMIQPEEE